MFWSWIRDRHFGNHQQTQRQLLTILNQAFNHLHDAQRYETADPNAAKQQLGACRDRLEEVYLHKKFPHSSTPKAKLVEAYRKHAGDQSASYYMSIMLADNLNLQLENIQLGVWRGVMDGLMNRFDSMGASDQAR